MGLSRWTPILYDITQALESVQEPEARIDRVLELLGTVVSYDRAALFESKPRLIRAVTFAPEPPSDEVVAPLKVRLRKLLGLFVEDAPPRQTEVLEKSFGVHLAVPILSLGEIAGLLYIERNEPAYSDKDLAFLSIVAAQFGAYFTAVRADRSVRKNVARFQGLYRSDMLGIAFSNADAQITEANSLFLRLMGHTKDELLRGELFWDDLTPPEYIERDRQAAREVRKNTACVPYEKEFITGRGDRISALVGAALLEEDDGHLVAFVLDITDRKRVESEKSTLLNEREQDVEFLEMFVAMLGHDLRNPLTAIRLLTEVLRLSEDETLQEPIDQILTSTDRMVRMVDQLVDLTRIRLADGIPLQREETELSELANQAINEVEVGAPQDVSIDLEIQGDTTGRWDRHRLLQVISNLIGNAVQHAEGKRHIGVSTNGRDEHVVLTVHNFGAIEPHLLPTVFEPFQGRDSEERSESLGLGLFIARYIVEAHGGTIAVDSSERTGTTFTVTLPRS